MRSYILGFLSACFVLGAFGLAAALSADEEVVAYAEDVLNEVVKNNCDVRIGSGSITAGTRCRFNRVLTGFDNNYLYCSEVSVQCRL